MKSIILISIALVLTACSGGKQPNVELIQDMMESPAIKAQEYDANSPDNRGMRLPPEHTIPVGFKPYKYATDYMGAVKNPNPMASDFSEATLLEGQKYYALHCAVCHGDSGKGDGPVNAKLMLKAPPVVSDKIKGWTDGQIYHVVVAGQGLMQPYASHIVKEEWRWALVNYIRQLQKDAR